MQSKQGRRSSILFQGRQGFVKKQRPAALLFLLPGFWGVAGFVFVPFADVLRRSFVTAVTGEFAGLSNYRSILNNQAFWLAVKNTARFALVCLPLLISLGLLIALMLSSLSKTQLFKSAFLFPMAMPAVTVVLVWRMLFEKEGFLNQLTGLKFDYMDSDCAFWVLVFTYLWKNLGYTVVLWAAGIHQIPAETLEAASVDGAGAIKKCFLVMLPQLKGTLYTITVLSFLNSFKVFREAYLVAGAYPQQSMYLLQHLFNNWFSQLELDKMAAAAVCIAGCLLAVILLLQRLWEEDEKC